MVIQIKACFTCCDYVYHEHRWYWTAWLCGKLQYLRFRRRTMSDLDNHVYWIAGDGSVKRLDGYKVEVISEVVKSNG